MKDLSREIQSLAPWFHNLRLPDGTETCPGHTLGDFPRFKWLKLGPYLPADLSGASVLDIGCNAGFYSLELARRGAEVTALDIDEHYLNQARWATRLWGLSHRIQFHRQQVYELSAVNRRWDIVLFLGVFYHLRYPVLGLDIVSRCVDRMLVLQSLTAPGEEIASVPVDLELLDRAPLARPGWPRLSFIEHRIAGDRTNWWAPNRSCMEAMLRSTGMRVVARPEDEFFVAEPDPNSESSMWNWNEGEYWAALGHPRRGHGGNGASQ